MTTADPEQANGGLATEHGERLRVEGLVQGVGFRPFVWRLGRDHGLRGRVWNDAEGVVIELWGPDAQRQRFRDGLWREAPPLARVDAVREVEGEALGTAPEDFTIAASGSGPARTGVVPDAPVCPDCLAELFDPAARRYRYPFLNCTHCGPRYTITAAIPYDRPNTALAGFPLCEACRAEYADPADRRFHAQAAACPACGPRLTFRRAGEAAGSEEAVAAAVAALGAGQVVAIKGVGGYHLAVNARDRDAVARLRQRKERSGKPFALMAVNPASLAALAEVGPVAQRQLEARARPIVLLPKRPGNEAVLEGIAPGLDEIGAMLPYAPLHYLLFHEAAGRPADTDWLEAPQDLLMVMTSANPGGEPLVTDNAEAAERLAGIADAFLEHDRPILVGCDDSVVRPRRSGDGAAFIRRSRGHVPDPVPLPDAGPNVLATGAWLKNTVCLSRHGRAYPSQHVGDLANAATVRAMEQAADHLERILEAAPATVACDRHPDFPSTRFAREVAEQRGLPLIEVQHHHAHIAAVAAEHGLTGPVLGAALDGVGLGPDGEIWGGELLRVDGAHFERLGGMRPLTLPGGDRAAREPWRVGAGVLHELGRWDGVAQRFPDRSTDPIGRMLERGVNCPRTSSAGRLFDAAAALLGLREESGFEGQAAMELEARARAWGEVAPMAGGTRIADGTLDWGPLMASLAECDEPDRGAALFHATLADGLVDWVVQAAQITGLERVLLGGGCWINDLLQARVRRGLSAAGLAVFAPERLPPGDGGLSVGQVWVATQAIKE